MAILVLKNSENRRPFLLAAGGIFFGRVILPQPEVTTFHEKNAAMSNLDHIKGGSKKHVHFLKASYLCEYETDSRETLTTNTTIYVLLCVEITNEMDRESKNTACWRAAHCKTAKYER